MTTSRYQNVLVINQSCDVCGESVTRDNTGLNRAAAAAWDTRHQHLDEED